MAVSILAGHSRRWLALVVLCLGQFMIALDGSIVNVALPSIQADLHFTQDTLTWVVNAYLITYGSFQLFAGRLGDLVGRKRVFLGGLIVFTAASVLCGLASDPTLLVIARFIQGLGAAVASSVVVAILITEFVHPAERAQAMSVYMFVIIAGASFGLLAGGALTQALNWHWIFFVNLPVGLLALLLGYALIEENRGLGLGNGVDVAGSVLVTASLVLGVYTIVTAGSAGWGSLHTVGLGGLAIGLLTAFFLLEARLSNPIMPMHILRLRSLSSASVVRAVLGTSLFSTFFFGALYLGHILQYSPTSTGVAFLPLSLGIGTSSLGLTARLMARFGPKRVLLAGLLLTTAGLALLSVAGQRPSYFPGLFSAFLLLGIGAGNSFMPLLTIAMAEVPRRDSGVASGISNVAMQVSAAIGLAALGTIATGHSQALVAEGHDLTSALADGYQLAFAIATVAMAMGLLVAAAILGTTPGVGRAQRAEGPVPAVDDVLETQAS
jgi:EmrB/QacA subfamily drug resistance transporter